MLRSFFIDEFFKLDFVELQIDFLEELGLYVDNLRFVRQENCDDGIGRPDCEANPEFGNNGNSEITSFDFEDIIVNIEEFLQTSIDNLFNLFHWVFSDFVGIKIMKVKIMNFWPEIHRIPLFNKTQNESPPKAFCYKNLFIRPFIS